MVNILNYFTATDRQNLTNNLRDKVDKEDKY